LKTGKRGTVEVDAKQLTSREGIFAGGDLSRGGATVILAMRDGKEAAAAIHACLQRKRIERNGEVSSALAVGQENSK
jgi:glutamate synthase (NADPH/NADH) small chain